MTPMKTSMMILLLLALGCCASAGATSSSSNKLRTLMAAKDVLKSRVERADGAASSLLEEEAEMMGWHVHWPHGHIPHVHWPHAHIPHVHICSTLDEGIGTPQACCTKTANYGPCSAEVSMCFALNSNSQVKAKICPPGAYIKISPNISATVTAQCSHSFEVAEEKEKQLFRYGIAKAELAVGYSFNFNAGLHGSVSFSMSPEFAIAMNYGSNSGSIPMPILEMEAGATVSVDAEMYVGLGMAAVEIVGLGMEAVISTAGSIDVTPGGISADAGLTGSIVGRAALQFPDLSLPNPDICAADFSFGSFSLPSIGHEFEIASFNWGHSHNPHSHNPHGHSPHNHSPLPTLNHCSWGLLEEDADMRTREASAYDALTTDENCDICVRVVEQVITEYKAGTVAGTSEIYELFNEECQHTFADSADELALCLEEIQPVQSLSDDMCLCEFSHHSALEICSGAAEDAFVTFCTAAEDTLPAAEDTLPAAE